MRATPLRIGWVLGWAVPAAWFHPLVARIIPSAAHVCFAAKADVVTDLSAAKSFDVIAGYSLGAQILLRSWGISREPQQVVLFAPIFGFTREMALGGRTEYSKLNYLIRWLRRDRRAALADFYARAGLDLTPELSAALPMEDLLWGLSYLGKEQVPESLPQGWRAWVGSDDPLLDGSTLAERVSGLQLVPGANHHPAELIKAWAIEALSPTSIEGDR